MSIKVNTQLLKGMLLRTKRIQCVGGKPQPQVTACVLSAIDDRVSTTSLVRDGKTSLSKFIIPTEAMGRDKEDIPVPDIDRVLGVLGSHSSPVKIEYEDNKLIFSSGKKKTRLTASLNGLAFPHSSETILEWGKKSDELSSKFVWDDPTLSGSNRFKGYAMASGETREPSYVWKVDANELFEALRCDNMNGQKLNRYTISIRDSVIRVGVGEELKGFTIVEFANDDKGLSSQQFEMDWDFEGGLENVLAGLSGDIIINILDFSKEGQGMRLVIDLGERGFVYQAGVIR